jgi:hypothetical protein
MSWKYNGPGAMARAEGVDLNIAERRLDHNTMSGAEPGRGMTGRHGRAPPGTENRCSGEEAAGLEMEKQGETAREVAPQLPRGKPGSNPTGGGHECPTRRDPELDGLPKMPRARCSASSTPNCPPA